MADSLPNKASTQSLINSASQNLEPTTPKVSVIMNCLNGAEYLREAIDSVYAQTYTDWEIIFWDNASTDNSAEIAHSYDMRLLYFHGQERVPLGKARNLAIEKASGEYIAFLDCDDKWRDDKLQKQIPILENNPRVGLVFSDALDFFEQDKTVVRHFRALRCRPPQGNIFRYLLMNYVISMPTVVLRSNALNNQTEWFDNSYQVCTDYDLFLRIAHDWECAYVNEPLVTYRITQASITMRFHEKIAEERKLTLEKFCSKHSDFEVIYKKELVNNRRIIAFQEAKSLWRNGQSGRARRHLRKHLFTLKSFLTIFATFFPYPLINRLLNFLRGLCRVEAKTI